MIRTLDPANLNVVANHPEVRPWLGGEGQLDLSTLIRNPRNFTLEIDGGGFIFHNLGNGNYEAHSQFIPEVRRHTLSAMRYALDYMFTRTDCRIVVTQIPDSNPAAASLGRKGGFTFLTRNENTLLGPSNFVALTIEQWIANNPALEADGERFHDACNAAAKAQGIELPEHNEDAEHQRYVGAVVRMAARSNLAKAAAAYTPWALLHGYSPFQIVSETPVLVLSDGAFVSFADDGAIRVQFGPDAAKYDMQNHTKVAALAGANER